MSEKYVEIVRRAYEAWNRRDFDAAIAHVDPEVDWIFVGATRFPGTEAAYHGREAVREFWRVLIEPLDEFKIDITDARGEGDVVVADVLISAKVRGGLHLETPFVHIFEFRDGKVVRYRSFDNRADALEAAGLSE